MPSLLSGIILQNRSSMVVALDKANVIILYPSVFATYFIALRLPIPEQPSMITG